MAPAHPPSFSLFPALPPEAGGEPQHEGRARRGHHDAPHVDPGDAAVAQLPEEPASEDAAHDAEHDVPQEPLAAVPRDPAADEAADQADDDPLEDGHGLL